MPVLGISTFPFWVSTMFWSAGNAMSIKLYSLFFFCRRVMSGLFCFSFLSVKLVTSNGSFTTSFSMTGEGWFSCQLLNVSSPYFLQTSQCTRRAILVFLASFEHPLVKCLMVSVPCPHSLHSGVSDILSLLNLMAFVLNACYCVVRIMPYVPFLENLTHPLYIVCPHYFSRHF